MKEGIGQIKSQIGGKGVFAVVELAVEPCELPGSVVFPAEAEEDCSEHYLDAVKVGVAHAWERLLLAGKQPPHLRVEVRRLLTSNVDTTVMMVVFCAAEALFNALRHDPAEFLRLEKKTRTLRFSL